MAKYIHLQVVDGGFFIDVIGEDKRAVRSTLEATFDYIRELLTEPVYDPQPEMKCSYVDED